MKIEVPDDIAPYFLDFLDCAQAGYTEEDVADFTDDERKVLAFVESLIPSPSKRWANRQESQQAAKGLRNILKGGQ
jgi:hypothetical protein